MNRLELDNSNPLERFYEDYETILAETTIKYNSMAEENETFHSKAIADQYKAAIQETDTYMSYSDYTIGDYYNSGLDQESYGGGVYNQIVDGDYLSVPDTYRNALLKARRQRAIDSFEEENNYYRMLNGLPPYGTKPENFYYLSESDANRYGIDKSIPIHMIQDHYNEAVHSGSEDYESGDYYISCIEAAGILDRLMEVHPDETYLKYIGSNRIDIISARDAGNFELLNFKQKKLKTIIFDEFTRIYEQCRLYFLTCIYQVEHRKIIDYYDNFIAMMIMLMTLAQLTIRSMPLAVNRQFFRYQGIRMLYEAYDVPYDMGLDEIQQQQIVEHLNLLIVWKASNQVLYDITELLGFTRINIYKYYLMKSRRYDNFGVPVVATKEAFNTDTGEVETIPDYEAMYDVWFEKMELRQEDFLKAFTSNSNREEYEAITTGDPFWWEDTPLYKERTETPFNYVETKYISLGINYSMTELMYECILMPKMVMYFKEELDSITLTLPKIAPDLKITLFDCIVYYVCLVCAKHHLKGDILDSPIQCLDVIQYMKDIGNDEYLVDAYAFNFDLLKPDNEKGRYIIGRVLGILTPELREEFLSYLEILSIDSEATNEDKLVAFNTMFMNIRKLNEWIEHRLTATTNRQEYETLKMFYRAAYYSAEMRDTFDIIAGDGSVAYERTAWTYFEYLYYENQALYNTMFTPNYEDHYQEWLEEEGINEETVSFEEWMDLVYQGTIKNDYGDLNVNNPNLNVTEDLLYYYIDHVIYRLSDYIDNIDMLYVRNDTETPLEGLLVRLIKFFKSFTVDFVGFDITLIMDFKNDNILKFFDEVYYMEKYIQTDISLNWAESDIIKSMITFIWKDDRMKASEELAFISILEIFWKKFNNLNLHDILWYIESGPLDAMDHFSLYDVYRGKNDLVLYDNPGMRMKDVAAVEWGEEEDDDDE